MNEKRSFHASSRQFAFAALAIALSLAFGAFAVAQAQSSSRPEYALSDVRVVPASQQSTNSATIVPALATETETTNRADCESIRGTDYLSFEERQWFLANCIILEVTPASETVEGSLLTGYSLPAGVAHVTAIGDSVMLGAAPQLAALGVDDLDAAVSRQVSTVISILAQRAQSGQLADEVLLHIGNNGTFTDAQFDQIMAILGSDRHVVFVNVKEPRSWQDANNDVIARGVARYANTALADWQGASAGRDELFYDDSIHLRPAGAQVYASLIASVL